MNKIQRTIKVLPQKMNIKAADGERLFELLMQHDIVLRYDCGGKGRCQKCIVEKQQDDGGFESIESCQYDIETDLAIKIPATSLASPYKMDKARIILPKIFAEQIKKSSSLLDSYGIAVDLGTTTIAMYLISLSDCRVVSSVAVKNPQSIYGDDVISRIGVILNNQENLGKLNRLVVKIIEWGLEKLSSEIEETRMLCSKMVIVGNPTMIHIVTGTNPATIGTSPFQPVLKGATLFRSDQLGFNSKTFFIQTLPNVSGFIGGDILAAALAVEMEKQPEGTLLIDLGTNGELFLKGKNAYYTTSCATGPAFEGASISCGMPAIPGAITSIKIDEKQNVSDFSIIASTETTSQEPLGICGAGVISGIAQFIEKKVILPNGAFGNGQKKYTIIPEDTGVGSPSIYISQKDIRSVQLGKSALITGINFLMKKAGIHKPAKIIIAGAFGSHLNKQDIVKIGMIPEIQLDLIEMAGNAAGAGAIMALLDESFIDKVIQIAEQIKNISLGGNVEFENEFINNLNFSDSK